MVRVERVEVPYHTLKEVWISVERDGVPLSSQDHLQRSAAFGAAYTARVERLGLTLGDRECLLYSVLADVHSQYAHRET